VKLSQRFADALIYATRAHGDQVKKGSNIPYIAHVLGVAAITLEYGGSETEAIGALLHDVVEDCGGGPRLQEIRDRFGQAVAKIVDGCTDTDRTPKPPWRERKKKYVAHLGSVDASTLLVSASDKLYNARAILRDLRREGDHAFEKFNGRKKGTLWYYRALAKAFRHRAESDMELIDELGRVVTEIETIAAHRP
jgi:GTP pyrophosphokinase